METPFQKQPQFIFQRSKEAAYHNALILQNYDFNIDAAIRAQKGSQVHYGSGFKHPSHIHELVEHHPHWTQLKKILNDGATFPIIPIDNKDQQTDLIFHKECGYHKSTSKHLDKLHSIISEEITPGFALPLPIDILLKIPNASLASLGCQQQETINEFGEKIPKYQMTHDQSFPGPSGHSVNNRVLKDQLPPYMYSYVLLRSIHYIVSLHL
jgi:hypothetical protein